MPNLDEALLALEVAPLHESLVSLLQPDLVTELAGLSGAVARLRAGGCRSLLRLPSCCSE